MTEQYLKSQSAPEEKLAASPFIPKKALNPLFNHAYAYCRTMANRHYENFPVGSLLIPKDLRNAVAVIYAFGRSADDIADEGDLTSEQRLAHLQRYRERLQEKNLSVSQKPEDLIFIALHHVIEQYHLPETLFYNLLSAFEQDIRKQQYQNYEDLKNYCQLSANPIGQLLLHLTGKATETNLYYSDCICTAIQMINFLQDLESDLRVRNRCYLPLDEMQTLGISIADLKNNPDIGYSDKLHTLVQSQLKKIDHLLEQGKPLLFVLKGRLGFELRLTWHCAVKMKRKLQKRKNHFARPKLHFIEWPALLILSIAHTLFCNPLYKSKMRDAAITSALKTPSLEEYAKSQGIAKKSGFYYSLLGLTEQQKQALTTLYVFCREVDDIVDECPEPAIAEIKIHFWLQEIERVFLDVPQHPLGHALAKICAFYPLQKEYLKEILNGMLMDLENKKYATFTALSQYCYAVAGCVGLLVIEVFGYRGNKEHIQNFAKNLGTALQLVNIIRDVGEDVRRGRIYIPEEDLNKFAVSAEDIAKGIYSDNFLALMQYQAKRARHFYQQALLALPTTDYHRMQPGLIMGEIYFDLLNELEASAFKVLHQKIKLTKFRKLIVALRTILKITLKKYFFSRYSLCRDSF